MGPFVLAEKNNQPKRTVPGLPGPETNGKLPQGLSMVTQGTGTLAGCLGKAVFVCLVIYGHCQARFLQLMTAGNHADLDDMFTPDHDQSVLFRTLSPGTCRVWASQRVLHPNPEELPHTELMAILASSLADSLY